MITAVQRREVSPRQGIEDDAVRLEALVREAREAGISRRGLVLRLSLLPRHVALPHHMRLARDAVEPLAMADRARVFELPNHDIVVVWRGEAQAALNASLEAIRLLFEDDLTLLPEPPNLTTVIALPEDGDALTALVAASRMQSPGPVTRPITPPRPLDLATLASVETALGSADIARLVRRRAVCSRTPAGGLRLRWELRLISIAELGEDLAPGTDIAAEPWLFRRLTRVLDRRMLALLAAPDELRGAGPFGLSLNVASLLSAEFLRFDKTLPAAMRGQVILGVSASDMLNDPAAFAFARDFVQARQYRLMLRAVPAELITTVPLNRTGMDLIELAWSPALATLDVERISFEPRRTVVAGVDTPDAMTWAETHDVAFITGRLAVPDEWRRPGT